jgi:hypothetical protein
MFAREEKTARSASSLMLNLLVKHAAPAGAALIPILILYLERLTSREVITNLHSGSVFVISRTRYVFVLDLGET